MTCRTLLAAAICCGLLAAGPAARAERPINRASPSSGPDGTPLSPQDFRELEAIEKSIADFENASRDYRGTVSHVVRQEYDRKRRELLGRFDAQIHTTESEEKVRRVDAITLFEAWLVKYPNDLRWTPDVIFRLAELYFERSNDEYLAAVDTAQKASDAAAKSGRPDSAPSAPVTPDYNKTISLYVRLIKEFPSYRLIDGAFYLLGYCLGEMNKEPESRQAFLALTCSNHYKALDPPPPPSPSRGRSARETFVDPYAKCKAVYDESRFLAEAWTRIGEFHFDANELELAIAAYARVLKFKDSPYYDKALYKLAWSYYRADKYPEAIQRFDELVQFSDAKKSESGKEGSDLRQEAVQYLGISFAEKDWNGDGTDDFPSPLPGDPLPARERAARVQALTRINDFYKERDQLHVREVFQRLGDIYFDETEYVHAIQVYKLLLERWPLAPDDPKVQDRIVACYEKMREFDKGLEARGELVARYAPGGEWDKFNRDNSDAIKDRNERRESALVNFAVNHHKAAQQYKQMAFAKNPPDGQKLQLALKEYGLAAQGYADYLKTFPNSRNTYEYTFYHAEALYYSQKFQEAAEEYEKIRDSNLDNRFLEDAAFDAVKSWENLVDTDQRTGKLRIPEKPQVGKIKPPVTPIPLPDEIHHLQAAYDGFVARVPQSGKVPVMQYKAAELDFKYLDFEKMRPRMEALLAKFCKGNEIGGEAGSAILATYSIDQNLDKIIEWGERLQRDQCGAPGKPGGKETGTGVAQTIADARFLKAQQAFDAGKYETASEQFVKIVDGDPKNKSGNNDKALYNAAVGYEKVERPNSATRIYERIVNEYPNSKFVDDALFRTAVNYQRFFEFDKAVGSYQRLALEPRFKESAHRNDALFNAAVILENDQNYPDAARLFQQWSKDPKVSRKDAGDAVFRAAQIFQKDNQPKKAIATFSEYLKSYSDDPKKTIEADFHIAEALEQQKQHAAALRQYQKIVEEGVRVAPATDAAEFPAHAAFILAEQELPRLEKLKMSSNVKNLKHDLDQFTAEINRLKTLYERAISFRRATWALAAFYRIGYCYELMSKALGSVANSSCPPEVEKLEKKMKRLGETDPDALPCGQYLNQLTQTIEKEVAPIDEEVVKRYRVTMEQAAKFGASNEWTKQARQRAHAYKPDEFPLTKDEKIENQLEDPTR